MNLELYFQNVNTVITCIRVISTVDYMVAVGNDQGIVTVFQIPKQPPDSLPESLKPKQKKQVKIFFSLDFFLKREYILLLYLISGREV